MQPGNQACLDFPFCTVARPRVSQDTGCPLDSFMGFGFIGTNTESAMHCGVSQGIVSEINTVISNYEAKFDFLTVILTGGDVEMLPKPLKNSIFAQSNFLAKGLNFLLASNTNS